MKRGIIGAMKNARGASSRDKFENAFKIVVWRLTEGVKGGEKSKRDWRIDPETLKLTKLGRDIQREKQTDRAALAKIKEFDRVVADLRRVIEREEL